MSHTPTLSRWLAHPRAAVVMHDLLMATAAWLLAIGMASAMLDVPVYPTYEIGLLGIPLVLAQALLFWRTGLYKGLWRFASFRDLWNIIVAAVMGTAGALLLMAVAQWPPDRLAITAVSYPAILFLLLGLPRMCYRFWKDSQPDRKSVDGQQTRTLILGAGRSGVLLLKELQMRGGFDVVGFLDDDRRLRDTHVRGVPVFGSIARLPELGHVEDIDLAIIAIPSATNQQMQRVVEICERSGIEFRTLPTLQDLGNRATRIGDLKPVAIDDLLGREPVSLDWQAIRSGLVGKRVLVTGGGGSIGAELCRQIARLNPASLVVVDHNEYNLYRIEHELFTDFSDLVFHCHLGDVCDSATVDRLLTQHRPDLVFHAAAYKHVPLLQQQLREAFRNNVIGTLRMAEAAERHGVGTFILISTDKAVNPSNIMGATKRIAEIYCQNLDARSNTRFITVRFGNVLNSNGSVVPLFKSQIRNGGPVTVTHPEIARYFMTIAEASQLIMQSAVLGDGGEIFVLDMGEPVKITYLAEQLIRLAGKEPGRDIQIIYTGLRPGEKLFEELFHEQEPYADTRHEKILLAHSRPVDWYQLSQSLVRADSAVRAYDTDQLKTILSELVPELSDQAADEAERTVVPFSRHFG